MTDERGSFRLPPCVADSDAVQGGADRPLIGLCESAGPNGEDLAVAACLAAQDAGTTVRVVTGDDGRDPGQAREVAQRMCSQGVQAVVGHFGSTTAIPASQVYGAAGVPYLAPGTSAPGLCGPHAPTTLQVFGTDDGQLACLLGASGGGRALVVGQLGNYGAGLARELFLQLASRCSAARVVYARLGQEALPVKALVGFESAYVLGSQGFARAVCALPAVAGADLPLLFSDDSFSPAFFAGWAGAASSRVAFLSEMSAVLVDRPVTTVRRDGAFLLGRPTGPYFETAYLAVRAVLAVSAPGGQSDGAALIAAIRSRAWNSPYGMLRFDASGRLAGHRWTMVDARTVGARAALPTAVCPTRPEAA